MLSHPGHGYPSDQDPTPLEGCWFERGVKEVIYVKVK